MSIGIWQILLILVVVLLVFGAGKLPTMMGEFAKGIKSFRKGLHDDRDDEEKSVESIPQIVEARIGADRVKP